MAISTVSIHVFGDVPSSPLVGVLQVTPPKIFVMFYSCALVYSYDWILL